MTPTGGRAERGFYALLRPAYDDFFPLECAAVEWALSLAAPALGRRSRVLDLGCGTGSLALALAERGCEVMGIDIDEGLLAVAKEKAARAAAGTAERLRFRRLDIRDAGDSLDARGFDLVLCLGNTLPHLRGEAQIGIALKGWRRLIAASGALGLQIIDFERIARLGLPGLPPLKSKGMVFERDYDGLEVGKNFDFTARLQEPGAMAGRTAEASISLFALGRGALDRLLMEAGFSQREYSGGFRDEAADGTCLPLVAAARP